MKPIRFLCLLAVFVCLSVPTVAQTVVNASISITNFAGATNGATITINGTVYTWTNSTASLRYIAPTNSAVATATNLYLKLSAVLTNRYFVTYGSSTNVTLRSTVGRALTVVVSTNWAELTTNSSTAGSASIGSSNIFADSITLAGSNITAWGDIGGGAGTSYTNNSSSLPGVIVGSGIGTNLTTYATLTNATNAVVGHFATVAPVTNAETRDITFHSIVAARTNYTDRVEATNSSTLTLRGGSAELRLSSSSVTVDASGGLVLGSQQVTSWDDVTNFFTLPSTGVAITSGVSTNQTLYGDVVISSAAWSVAGDGQASFSAPLYALTLSGNGENITNINGQNIQSGSISNAQIADATINSNKLDAATVALFGGSGTTYSNITESGYTTTVRSNLATSVITNNTTISSGTRISSPSFGVYDSGGVYRAAFSVVDGVIRLAQSPLYFGGTDDAWIRREGVGLLKINGSLYAPTNVLVGNSITATNGFMSGTATNLFFVPSNAPTAGQIVTATADGRTAWSNAPSGSDDSSWTNTVPVANSITASNITGNGLASDDLEIFIDNSTIRLNNTNITIEATEPGATISLSASNTIVTGDLSLTGSATLPTASVATMTVTDITSHKTIDLSTNLFVINGPLYVGTNWTYTSGAATGGITGVGNGPTTTERFGQLTIKATGDITFTNPAAFYVNDYVDTRVITNGNTAVIAIRVLPGLLTNMAIVQFR